MSGVTRSPILLLVAAVFAVWAARDGVLLVLGNRHFNCDYVQDYLAARALARGESVYIPSHPPTLGVPDHPDPYPNDHPPTYVLFLAPLAELRYDHAFVVFGLASLASAGLMGWIVARELGAPIPARVAVVAAALWHPGVATCLWVGNVSLLIALMVTLAWVSARRGADRWAGFWVGLATSVKLFPGLLLLAFLPERRWRALGAAIATGVTYVALTVAIAGVDDMVYFARERAPANTRDHAGHAFNLSLSGAVQRTFGEPCSMSPWLGRVAVWPGLAKGLALLAQGAVGVGLLVVLFRAPRGQRTPDRSFALLVPAMLLLSPFTWLHIVPLMLLPIAILVRDAWHAKYWGHLAALGVCGALLCVDDRELAIHLLARTQAEVLPWWGNVLLLAPTWGMLGIATISAASSSAALSSPTDRTVSP